jgi:Flp pilus assembly protein TadD
VTLLQPSFDANPEDLAVDYALGTALIREGQISRGEGVIDRILKKGDSAEANLLMGEAQFEAGDYKRAAATLRKTLDLNSGISEAWSLYGRVLLHNEDAAGAKEAFHRALQVDPNDFQANIHLGSLLRSEGDLSGATPYVERALQLRPSSPEANFQQAALCASTGRLAEARKMFEELERNWPDFLEVRVQLAALYARMNLKEKSERERATILKLNEKARQENPRPTP